MKTTSSLDVMVLHPLGNEIEKKTSEICSQDVEDTVVAISDKFKDVKMIVSLGLPRADASLNRKVEKTNILIKEKLSNRKNVYLCDNANLFYRGDAQRGVLNDGLNLTNMGTRKLGRNLKDVLWDMYDLPQVTSETRVEDKAPYKDKNEGFSGYSGVQHGGYRYERDEEYRDYYGNQYGGYQYQQRNGRPGGFSTNGFDSVPRGGRYD